MPTDHPALDQNLRKRLQALSAHGRAIDDKLGGWPLDDDGRDALNEMLAQARHLIEQTVDMALAADCGKHPELLAMRSSWTERYERMGKLIAQREQELAVEAKAHLDKNRAAQAYVGTGRL